MPKVLNFKVVLEQDERGYFVASVPAIPRCHSQGKTYEEVLKNVREAIELCLEVANIDLSYKENIDLGKTGSLPKFLGITEVPIRFQFS